MPQSNTISCDLLRHASLAIVVSAAGTEASSHRDPRTQQALSQAVGQAVRQALLSKTL